MSANSNLEDGFKLITYKRKNTNKSQQNHKATTNKLPANEDAPDFDKTIRRINEINEEYLNSNVHTSIKALLTEGLILLENPKITEIVCFGLGSIGSCITSRYQFSCLLYIKNRFNISVSIYDPVFTQFDIRILKYFNCEVLTENSEGKFNIKESGSTVFYLPHCPKQLSNNLLWKNWGLKLTNCIFISNSFTKIVESNSSKILFKNANFITSILPYTIELSIINEFKFYDVFNDMSIHVFPINKLNLLPEDFWKNIEEPVYSNEDLEFVTNKLKAL